MIHPKDGGLIGKTIFHYKIIEKLGWGGMGIVYKAQDLKLDRFVALKFLPVEFSLDEEAKERFIHEAKAASSLQHQDICIIHEINTTEEGQLFICMEYYEGETLREKINTGLLKIDEALEILIKVLEGLSAAHEKGIVHRDIKPANIFITEKNKVKILDFGLAKSSAYSKITKSDRTSGTIAYISPEQAQGKEATNKSDIWSLGVVMYEMLSGQLPFKGEYDQVLIYSILDKAPEKITSLSPEIPLELEQIANRALEKDSDSRYQNVDEMLADLLSYSEKETLSSGTKLIIKQKDEKKQLKTIFAFSSVLVLATIILYLIKPTLFGDKNDNIPVTLAVVGFENQTGDSTYNYLRKAIPNLLITNLEQSKTVRVTTWERMHDLLKQTHKEKIEIINKDLGFELSEQAEVDAIVVGSFVKAGDVFVTDVKVLDARTKKMLKSANIKSNGLASILNSQIDYLSEEIVKGVGLTAKEMESVKLRIADVSTTSMEAYNLFLKGREEFYRSYYIEALKFFEKAIQIDSTFAVAHLFTGLALNNILEYRKGDISFSMAEKYKDHATDKAKSYIEAIYELEVNRNIEKSTKIFEEGAAEYPKEKFIHFWLGYIYTFQGKFISAQKEYSEVLKLDPDYELIYKYIAESYAKQGEYEKALENMNKFVSMFPQNAESYKSLGTLLYKMGRIDNAIDQIRKSININISLGGNGILPGLLFMKEEYVEAMEWQDKILKTRRTETLRRASLWWKGFGLYWIGSIKQAVSILETYENNEQLENLWIARADWLKGWINYNEGRYELSKRYFSKYFNYRRKVRSGLDVYTVNANSTFYYGLIDLRMNRIDSARINLGKLKDLSKKINIDFSNNVIANHYLLYGKILIVEDSLDKAADILESKPPHKLLSHQYSNWSRVSEFIDPLPQDDLALVYIKNGELNKAIIEYEKLLSPEVKVRGGHFINPKYHYRLAKLYEEKGQAGKAIDEYKKFLEIWENADFDLPELIDAKKRLAGLTVN